MKTQIYCIGSCLFLLFSVFSTAAAQNLPDFRVNETAGGDGSVQASPSISGNGSGFRVITWQDYRNGSSLDIFAQIYLDDGTPCGNNFRINNDTIPADHYRSVVAVAPDMHFVVVWIDNRNGNWDIYAQRVSGEGTLLDDNFKVNDDLGSENQQSPDIAVDGNNNFVVAWSDFRKDDEDIYCQRFYGDGTPIGSNFRVNDNTEATMQENPSVDAAAGGNFVITWGDVRDGYVHDIYAQLYHVDGTPIGTNFKVNYLGAYMHYSPAVACAENGDFIITWWDTNDGGMINDHENSKTKPPFLRNDMQGTKSREGADIWAQRFLSDGTPVGTNFKVNDDQGDFFHAYPSIAADPDGNFIIAWEDDRNSDYDIYLQRYLADGTPVGSNIKLEDPVFSQYQWMPVVTIDGDGNFTIAWCDFRNGNYDIFAQRYKNDGTPVGNNFKVNSFGGSGFYMRPCISSDHNGDFIIGWTDNRTDTWDVYAQRFTSDGMTTGDNYRISLAGDMDQYNPSIALMNGRIFSAWQDNRGGQTGFDVWANVVEWGNWLGVNEDHSEEIPNESLLFQNRPNPFYSFTSIDFTLIESGHVALRIFDKTGRMMRLLVNEFLMQGIYTVALDGSEFVNGVYYYELRAGDSVREVRKMVVAR